MRVAVIGTSGGIGNAIIKNLCNDKRIENIYAFSRSEYKFTHKKVQHKHVEITDESSIAEAARACEYPLDLVVIATGMLHDDRALPEKSLRDIDFKAMQHCFAINTTAPALIAKYFLPLLPKDKRSVFACLSARVGSISDNRVGGWYAYRASKAALNMIIKNAAIEMARRYKKAVIIGLHPGTVDTSLSKPFQSNVKHDIFSPDIAAEYLLKVIESVSPDDSGKCFAWDGREVEP